MSMLFEIAPDEPTKKRRIARGSVKPAEAKEADSIKDFSAKVVATRPIGRIDDTYQCIDGRCGASCHDILLEERGQWLLGCCFCNCTQWLPAIPGHIKPREEQFVLRDGRFAGMTLDEVMSQPRGIDYITWAAEEHKRDAVKAACKTWLDQRNTHR